MRTRRGRLAALKDHCVELFAAIPGCQMLTPNAQVWADAGVVAGMLARTQSFQPHQRKECLNDALIFLTAAKAGLPVLTANRDEFDLIQQLATRASSFTADRGGEGPIGTLLHVWTTPCAPGAAHTRNKVPSC